MYTHLVSLYKVTWCWLDCVHFIKVSNIPVLSVIPLHLYGVKTVYSVGPSGSGLPQCMSTFGLRLGGEIRCSMAFIPCLHQHVFILKCLIFYVGRERGLQSYFIVKTSWIRLYGLSFMYIYPLPSVLRVPCLLHP